MTTAPRHTYQHLADVLSRAAADTGTLADALRVVDAYRLRAACGMAPLDSFEIISAAAGHFGVPVRRILERDRHPAACGARWVVVRILHERGWSSVRIGVLLGLNHTSVLHALRAVEDRPDLLGAAHSVLASILDSHAAVPQARRGRLVGGDHPRPRATQGSVP